MKNYTFSIKAGFHWPNYPETLINVTIGIGLSQCPEKIITSDSKEQFFSFKKNDGTKDLLKANEIREIFAISDTEGCDGIKFFDIVDENGDILDKDSDLGRMLGLDGSP